MEREEYAGMTQTNEQTNKRKQAPPISFNVCVGVDLASRRYSEFDMLHLFTAACSISDEQAVTDRVT